MAHLVRPLCLGTSIGHPHGFAGSIGGFVQPERRGEGATSVLSSATALWPKAARKGDYVHQPGPIDNPLFTGESRVAVIPETAVLSLPARERLDAAYAEILAGIAVVGNVVPDGMPGAGGRIAPPGEPPRAGDRVAKIGRGSGVTFGRIATQGGQVTLQALEQTRTWSAPSAEVPDVLEIEGENGPFSGPGDSGAVIFRLSDFQAVGLLFGSSREDGVTYAHDLCAVLRALRLRWV